MQTVCTSLQTDDHTNTSSLKIFYRPDALPDAHPTVVKALMVQRNTCCCPLSNMVAERRLRSFGETTRSAPAEGHHHAVAAAIHKPPSDWKRPPGRPNHTWLGVIKSDLRSLNIVNSYAWKKAASPEHWLTIVDTTMVKGVCHDEKGRTHRNPFHSLRAPGRNAPFIRFLI